MRRHARRLIWFLLLFTCAFAPAAQSRQSPAPVEKDAAAWKKLAPPAGGCTMLLPGTPTENKNVVDTKVGKLENRTYTLKTSMALYMVAYADFPDPISDPDLIKRMLDSGRDQALSNTNGKLKSEKDIKLDGHAGREWLVEMPDDLVARARAYWVRRRLYQAIVLMEEASNASPAVVKLHEDVAAKFLDSFALSGENAAR